VYINLLLLIVFFACFASSVGNGLWSNIILLINVVTAGLISTCYYENVADLFDDLMPSYGAAWDFLSAWLLFAGSLGVFSMATDLLSRVKVRFLKPVDQGGGIILAIWIGWVAVCFTTMTLHMAPLSRSYAGGNFQATPESRMFLGTAPDHRWLGFAQKMSRTAYFNGKASMFDPRADFIYKYAQRRLALENQGSWAVADRVTTATAKASAQAAATDTRHAPAPTGGGTP
jgi:uncharacterized membrane protein required for colicin V production